MTDIYSAVDLSNFQFTPRCSPFNWRLLHGLDVEALVRLNDTKKLEEAIPALQQGSIDAEGALSSHNYVQLFRLVQLAVEHLWQMRESHAKLYPTYVAAVAAAESWRAAAESYLSIGDQLLCQLQSEAGAVLTGQLLSDVAAAREALETADAAYNTALDKLEAEDAAARCHSLRRQRLEISWRLVFGLDVQHMLITGSVAQLESLLPQVAYGNIMAENPAVLTAAHFRQLLLLGQACLDYLHAICCATSKVLEQQVQQLAAGSTAIPQLTTASEELRVALTATLSSSSSVMKAGVAAASPRAHAPTPPTPTVIPAKPAAGASCKVQYSPSCHHIAHMQQTGHQAGSQCSHGATHSSTCCCGCPQPRPHNPGCCQHWSSCTHCSSGGCCSGLSAAAGGGHSRAGEYSALLSGRLLDMGLAPATSRLHLRIEQLDRDLRTERESTLGMRQALEEITAMLQELPSPTQPPQQHKQRHKQASPAKQQPPPQQQGHTVHVPVNISVSREGDSRGQQGSPTMCSPESPKDPSGAVRVLIDEDRIRARERSAASQQLSEHISDIIMGHHQLHDTRSPHSSIGATHYQHGSSPSRISNRPSDRPLVTVCSIPSNPGQGGQICGRYSWRPAGDMSGYGVMPGVDRVSGEFVSGPVRDWAWGSQSPTGYSSVSRHGVFSAEEVAQRCAWGGVSDAVYGAGPAGQAAQLAAGGVVSDGRMQQAMGLVLGDYMKQQLQQQAQAAQAEQAHWAREQASGVQVQPPMAATPAPAAPVMPQAVQGAAAGQAAFVALTQEQGPQADLRSSAAAEDPRKKQQQELFKEAAAGGFRKLLRSVSPKRMFGSRPSSASGGKAGGSAAAAAAAGPAAASAGADSLEWPPLVPGSAMSSPDSMSPTRSGRSFTATAAAKAAEELGLARRPLVAAGSYSPLKASIVANTG